MLVALLELVVAPALVGASTLAARRWGEGIGGLVSAFPAIVGPVLLIAAHGIRPGRRRGDLHRGGAGRHRRAGGDGARR